MHRDIVPSRLGEKEINLAKECALSQPAGQGNGKARKDSAFEQGRRQKWKYTNIRIKIQYKNKTHPFSMPGYRANFIKQFLDFVQIYSVLQNVFSDRGSLWNGLDISWEKGYYDSTNEYYSPLEELQ